MIDPKRTALALAMVFALALAYMPVATAQDQTNIVQVTISPETISPDPAIVQPVSGQVQVTAEYEVTISSGSVQPLAPIEFRLTSSVSGASWGTATITTPVKYVPINNQQAGSEEGQVETLTYQINIVSDDTAVAFSNGEVDLTLAATCGSGSTCQGADAPATFNIKPDMYSITSFQGQTIIKGSPNSPIVFPVTVVNEGNGDMKYTIDMDGGKEEWSTSINPPQFSVPPSQQEEGANQRDVTVQILSDQSTQYSNDVAAYQFNAEPRPKNTPPGGMTEQYQYQTTTLPLIVHIQGVYVPGFETVLALGALAAGGFIVRRRQRRKG